MRPARKKIPGADNYSESSSCYKGTSASPARKGRNGTIIHFLEYLIDLIDVRK